MKYLLDTCILIDLLKGKPGLQDKIMEVGIDKCFVADIILAELFVGPYKTDNALMHRQAEWIEREFRCVCFGSSYRTFGKIRAQLEKKGTKLDSMDLLIASIAIDNDLTLVTRNANHFSRIPGLRLETWA